MEDENRHWAFDLRGSFPWLRIQGWHLREPERVPNWNGLIVWGSVIYPLILDITFKVKNLWETSHLKHIMTGIT